jgi:hypothetical protein
MTSASNLFVVKSSASAGGRIPHEVVKSNVAQILIVWLIQNPMGAVFCDSMFQLDERNCLIQM